MKLTNKRLQKIIKEEIRAITEKEKKVPGDGPVAYYFNNMIAIDALVASIPQDGTGEYRKDTLNILIGKLDALADVYRTGDHKDYDAIDAPLPDEEGEQ